MLNDKISFSIFELWGLIVFFSDFKVALRMLTNGANLRSLFAHYKMATVSTLPNSFFSLFKYFLHFYIVEKCTVSFFV